LEDTNTTLPPNEEHQLQNSSQIKLGLDPVTWAVAGTVAKWVGEKAAGGLVSAPWEKCLAK